jgi:hypothetical protein
VDAVKMPIAENTTMQIDIEAIILTVILFFTLIRKASIFIKYSTSSGIFPYPVIFDEKSIPFKKSILFPGRRSRRFKNSIHFMKKCEFRKQEINTIMNLSVRDFPDGPVRTPPG